MDNVSVESNQEQLPTFEKFFGEDMIKVNIQNLPLKKQPSFSKYNSETRAEETKRIIEYNKNYLEPLMMKENYSEYENSMTFPDNFIGAFLTAYNRHGNVMISPDDIWIVIMLFFSKYINANSETLRNKFVDHDGQMKLVVKEFASSAEESLLMEKNWDYFFQEVIKQIDKNTKNDVVSKLKCDFSTTNNFYELVSTSAIMDTMKKYFSYERMICSCGINNVYFRGKLEDWKKLSNKVLELLRYDAGDLVMTKYVEHVKVILDKFVDSINGNVDVGFWNNILQSETRRVGSGGDVDTNLTGWMLHLFGIYTTTTFEDMVAQKTNMPIKLFNEFTGITKDLTLSSYFSSVCKINDNTYAPRLRIVIDVEKN